MSALGTPQYLAKGGTAKIYRLPGYSLPGEGPLIYKEYLPKTRREAGPALRPGLLALADFRAKLPADDRAKLDVRAIWAIRVVRRQTAGAGNRDPGDPRRVLSRFRGR